MDLSTLVRRGAELLARLAKSEQRRALGDSGPGYHSIFTAFDDLASSDAAACAREGLSAGDGLTRARGQKLLELVATADEGRRSSRSLDERDEFARRAEVRAAGEILLVPELRWRVVNEATREVRDLYARAFRDALRSMDAPLERRIEGCLETANALGYASYEEMVTATSGIDLGALSDEASRALAQSEEAYRDLTGFGLRRAVGPVALRPRGEASFHDLARLSRLAPLDDHFRAHRLQESLEAALQAIGLRFDAGGRIEADFERRPGKRFEPLFARIDVPREIAVGLAPLGGAADYHTALELLGRAQHAALCSERAPMEDRWLGDESVGRGFGVAFAQFLLDPGFMKRYLGLDEREGVEAARLFAIVELASLRKACAQLLFERTLYAEGPRADLRGLYRESLQKAMLVDWPVESWLFEVEPRFACARALRAFALAERLRRAMLDACDEDHWRNPRLGAFLEGYASRGQQKSADELAKELGGELSIAGAAARLIEVAAR